MQYAFQTVQLETTVSLNSLFSAVDEVSVHIRHLYNKVSGPNTENRLLNPVRSHLASEKVTGLILINKSVIYFCFSLQGKAYPFVPIL